MIGSYRQNKNMEALCSEAHSRGDVLDLFDLSLNMLVFLQFYLAFVGLER